jgi:hypothetical protein
MISAYTVSCAVLAALTPLVYGECLVTGENDSVSTA